MTKWRSGSRLDLFNEGVKRLGYEHIPLAWGLSMVEWRSKSELNQFIDALTYDYAQDQAGQS